MPQILKNMSFILLFGIYSPHQFLFLSFIENNDTFKPPNVITNFKKSNFAIMYLITAKN